MRKFIFLLTGCLFATCNSQTMETVNVLNYQLIKTLETYDDRNYFYHVSDIFGYNNEYFILLEDKIVHFDEDLQLIKSISSFGEGPGEMINAQSLFINEKGIFVTDAGKSNLLSFSMEGRYEEEWKLQDRFFSINNFVVEGNNFYFSSPFTKEVVKFSNLQESQICFQVGERVGNEVHNNMNFIIKVEDGVVAISTTNLFISYYNQEGAIKAKFDLPEKFFKGRIKFKEREILKDPSKANLEFSLIRDVYYNDKMIYLLINENIGEDLQYFSNKILCLEVVNNHFQLNKVIVLPSEVYTSFCVSGNNLLAFNHVSSQLEYFKMNNSL
jgi:hypothetical protein